VWRPLVNGPVLRHQSFPANNVRGFGLLQRDRKFDDYQDLFHSYENVPSVWVAPKDNWGDGQVHLVELSTQYEGLDNVVAFWNPAAKPAAVAALAFGYTIYWTRETDHALSSNKVVSTRVGLDPRDQEQRQFVIDFDAAQTQRRGRSAQGPDQLQRQRLHFRWCRFSATPPDNTWRVFLNMLPKPGHHEPVDLNARSKKSDG
jgi:periplasmic glucans biosynthesis protein